SASAKRTSSSRSLRSMRSHRSTQYGCGSPRSDKYRKRPSLVRKVDVTHGRSERDGLLLKAPGPLLKVLLMTAGAPHPLADAMREPSTTVGVPVRSRLASAAQMPPASTSPDMPSP